MINTIIVKKGKEITENEKQQVNESIVREFQISPVTDDYLKDKLFFFLKNDDQILSMGALWNVPVVFNGETFTISAFLEVIANVKGKGYGKQVVAAMRDHAINQNQTAFGFTMPKNIGFYEKCGMDIETNSTQRFVYIKNGLRITNKDGQVIFYKDASDHFMEKVIKNPNSEVSIPTDGLW